MFSFFKKKKIEPIWQYQSTGFIWRMLFSASEAIVIENRIKETRTVNFNCIALTTGNEIWRNFSLDEPWFVGLEAVHQGKVFLHGYFDPNLPEHLGIYCVHAESGTLLWYNSDVSYFYFADGLVFAYQDDPTGRTYFSMDAETGKIVENFGRDNSIPESKRELYPEFEGYDTVSFSDKMDSQHPQFNDMNLLIGKFIKQIDLSFGIDYLDLGENVIFGVYHRTAENKMCYSMLWIESRTAEVKLNEVIASEVGGQVGDLFFAKQNLLITIKNRNILQVYSLT